MNTLTPSLKLGFAIAVVVFAIYTAMTFYIICG